MLFRLSDVHKSYGGQDVLRGASLQINAGEHTGLVGRNGAGKTTIFRLISNEETPDRGDVVRARGLRLGLLAQHVHFEPGSTVHESALAAFGHLQQIEHEMHELEHRMAEGADDLEAVLERYSDLQQRFEREGGFEYAARAASGAFRAAHTFRAEHYRTRVRARGLRAPATDRARDARA